MHRMWRLGPVVCLLCWGFFSAGADTTPVEIWRRGDDGLTRRFQTELERVFKLSSDFSLSSGGAEGTWLVAISDHVVSKRSWRGSRAQYRVEFKTIDGRVMGLSQGDCPEARLRRCAQSVLRDATLLKTGSKRFLPGL